MKKQITPLILLALCFAIHSVSFAQDKPAISEAQGKIDVLNRRISFVVGPGASIITRKIYNEPVVEKTNNYVIIDRAPTIKSNLALGIIYTPYIYNIYRTEAYKDASGTILKRTELEVVPKGITGAVFINPVNFTKINNPQPFLSNLDFGIGLGYRYAGGVVLMATAEYFSVRQPRDWFIDEFKTNNKIYKINGATQTSIDINDNSIFTNKSAITFGFKVCYSFDIIKNYLNTSKNIGATTEVTVQPEKKPDTKSTDQPTPKKE